MIELSVLLKTYKLYCCDTINSTMTWCTYLGAMMHMQVDASVSI